MRANPPREAGMPGRVEPEETVLAAPCLATAAKLSGKLFGAVAHNHAQVNIKDLEEEIKNLRTRISALEAEDEEDDKQEKTASDTLNFFVEQALAVALAALLSNHWYSWIVCIWGPGTPTTEQQVICKLLYAVISVFAVSTLQYCMQGGACEGENIFRDTLKLLYRSLNMILAWGWKDLVAALVAYDWGDWPAFVHRFILAFLLVFGAGAVESIPIWKRLREEHAAGKRDGILLRVFLSPPRVRLSLGYALNSLVRSPVEQIAVGYPVIFIINAVQTTIMVRVIDEVTTRHQIVSTRLAGEAEKEKKHGPYLADDTEVVENRKCALLLDIALTYWRVLNEALAFVFGWSMYYSINDVVFGIYGGCLTDKFSPTTCSYQLNFAYAVAISLLFTFLTSKLKDKKSDFIIRSVLRRGEDYEIAHTAAATFSKLMENGMALTVGWAWTNFVNVCIKKSMNSRYVNVETNIDVALVYTVALVVTTLLMGYGYHIYLEEKRGLNGLDAILPTRGSERESAYARDD